METLYFFPRTFSRLASFGVAILGFYVFYFYFFDCTYCSLQEAVMMHISCETAVGILAELESWMTF